MTPPYHIGNGHGRLDDIASMPGGTRIENELLHGDDTRLAGDCMRMRALPLQPAGAMREQQVELVLVVPVEETQRAVPFHPE